VEELHAAIAAHLRAERQRRVCAIEEPILATWRERWDVLRCRYCGKSIAEGDDLWDVEYLRQARACADHYAPF
jgi:hypothetical protein